jgi:RNA polymerase sigma-70 factor (ECF subfamily)
MSDSKKPSQQGYKISEKSESAAKRDARLMKAIAENQDGAALSELFEEYGGKLRGWLMARGVGSATAEDIIQDVMIKVWTRAILFDPAKASFATWVYRLTRNRMIDHKRKHGRMEIRDPEIMSIVADDEVPSAEDFFIEDQTAENLHVEIARLTAAQQDAIRMAYMEFKTHKEIAEETGLPLGTVKTRIRSAIQALQGNMKVRSIEGS